MNLNYFISKRIQSENRKSFSSIVSVIAIISIAIGLMLMIISFAILDGFKNKIKDKIISFGSHIQVTRYDINNSYEETPVNKNSFVYHSKDSIPGIDHVQVFSMKAGLLKTDEEVMGVVLKGIGKDFYVNKFRPNIVKGDFIDLGDSLYSSEILISQKIADKMKLDLNDTVSMYFVQDPPRFRKLVVKGIYATGLEEFDDLMILGDIRLNQRLNNWADTMVGGFEIYVKDFNQLDAIADEVYDKMEYELQLEKITDKYIQIFDWLKLLNRNVLIFLILILTVACFNMISTLFIMIMERTNMIGVLKALGANNNQIQSIFLYNGVIVLAKGLFFGNLFGIGFCLLQYYFKIIPLDEENYYMSSVPIELDWMVIAGLNLMTFILITLVLTIPVMVVSRIHPIKAIKFS
ncbi:MAG TPA: FtsX-like permease family protein [Cytophagaceae bacterium]